MRKLNVFDRYTIMTCVAERNQNFNSILLTTSFPNDINKKFRENY